MAKGFDFNLTVNEIELITPRVAGESEIDGNDVAWGYAVKFTTRSIMTVNDKEFGEKDQEVTLEIEIPCDSKDETLNVNSFLRSWRNDPKPFKCDIDLPRYSNKIYKAKTRITGNVFISLFDTKTKERLDNIKK